MPSVTPGSKQYWRSMDELAETPEFKAIVENEFPYLNAGNLPSSSRRGFLKLMGASAALAGLVGCRWPEQSIVEYARRPMGRTPGKPVQFATAMSLNGVATGALVTSYDGRPVKVDGNPTHPFSLGRSDALMQAAILELYDPDRSAAPLRAGAPATWAEAMAALKGLGDAAKANAGASLLIISEPIASPTLADMKARLLAALPKATWVGYSPLSQDNERIGTQAALGKAARPLLDLKNAKVIASFDADLLMTHPAAVKLMNEFSKARSAADGHMNRLFVIEPNMSVTGSNADERFAEKLSNVTVRMAQVAVALGAAGVPLAAPALAAATKIAGSATPPPYVAELARELAAGRGASVVAAGYRLPPIAHALAVALNAALDNAGKTVTYAELPFPDRWSHLEAITAATEKLNGGSIETVVILGGNPVYDAPADLNFAAALGKAKNAVHLSLTNDETSKALGPGGWHLPAAHWLESWGDGYAYDGTLTMVQPLIAPLFDGKTAEEVIAPLFGDALTSGYDIVRRHFRERLAAGVPDFEAAWRKALHEGVVANTPWPKVAPSISGDWTAMANAVTSVDGERTFEITFVQDHKAYDGRFVNNGWLQELPDPITKMTWDNAAYMSPADANRLGIVRDDQIEISLGGLKMTLPVCPVPGHASGTITLPLGYGRRDAGSVAAGSGFNTYALRTRASFFGGAGATVAARGGSYALATTQDHHAMTSVVGNRQMGEVIPVLVRSGTLKKFQAEPDFVRKVHGVHSLPLVQLFDSFDKTFDESQRWAMSIDLSKCTGCSACVVACQAENNIPVVGKHEVRLGREMHWLRIDRYFTGDPLSDSVQVVHQPVPCQHCENAPCEQVCPVAATTHDSQGLNVMVYNRCIGTRYCANNCPYKVRRFNWFYNHHGPRHPRSLATGTVAPLTPKKPGLLPQQHLTEIQMMGMNPEVTVRSRGVMEKCSFCVQRIQHAKIEARNRQVQGHAGEMVIPDGTVSPACADACPAEAITFGDLNVTQSRVKKEWSNSRSYALLEEIGVRPRVRYLARLKNPLHEPVEHDAGHGGGTRDEPKSHDGSPASAPGHAGAPRHLG